MLKKTIQIFVLLFMMAILGFLTLTYFAPWEMLWDPARCGESPIGFYRLKIVPFELTDYGRAEVQAGAPIGGVWEFVKYYFSHSELCH